MNLTENQTKSGGFFLEGGEVCEKVLCKIMRPVFSGYFTIAVKTIRWMHGGKAKNVQNWEENPNLQFYE